MAVDEVLTMGRIGVDLYPQQIGVPLPRVRTFEKFLGGSPTNVAVAAARYGRRSAVITRTGADPFGTYLHEALRSFHVDDRFVTAVPGLPTPVTFCEIFPPDDFPLYFYRFPKAPDLEIHKSELDLEAIKNADIFWVTGTGLSQEPSRAATLTALKQRDKSDMTVFDLDYRPMFWESREEARHWYQQALPYASIVVGNRDEWETAGTTPDDGLAIVKQGPDGVTARRGRAGGESGAGKDAGVEEVSAKPIPVDVVNGLGAGDAFGGALCHGLLSGWDLATVIGFANAAGAIVASRMACADAMPTEDEVRAVMARA
ncbi:5-dehydro-2-deoxygluconokinase [Winogradskya consettensis]|uniref:5-dehydro-2-deoxygluconokinase n=1 Tax=Winogradskya consettensis TaxID=113560 RepID=A0A919W2P7_9ACTN|nr:5-dehydro-2-deoxygluconokinase [Actinoplanes consettensis]GIM77638.1 5-dehydro-2-deoxygluconokinase [Actinoplanes consettensis]